MKLKYFCLNWLTMYKHSKYVKQVNYYKFMGKIYAEKKFLCIHSGVFNVKEIIYL